MWCNLSRAHQGVFRQAAADSFSRRLVEISVNCPTEGQKQRHKNRASDMCAIREVVKEGSRMNAIMPLSNGPQQRASSLAQGGLELLSGAFVEPRVVDFRAAICNAVSVVIEGDRAAGDARRAGKRLGVPVPASIGRAEHDEAIADGCNALDAFAHVPVPKLKVPAPGFLPSVVEIKDGVKSAALASCAVPVIIDMYGKMPARERLVQSAACQFGIRDQRVNTGECFQLVKKRRAVQVMNKCTVAIAKAVVMLALKFFVLSRALVLVPDVSGWRRKSGAQALVIIPRQKIFNHDVRKRLGNRVGIRSARNICAEICTSHVKMMPHVFD